MMFRRLAILALGSLLALPALAADDSSALAAEYHAVASRLTAHVVESAWLDAAPEAPGLLDRHWALAGQWMAAWLDTHPQADAGALTAAFGEMQGTRDAVAAQARALGQGSWLVALPGPFGNVFILARRDGHYRVAWNIARQRVPARAVDPFDWPLRTLSLVRSITDPAGSRYEPLTRWNVVRAPSDAPGG
mgnify:CR=1 FL=1